MKLAPSTKKAYDFFHKGMQTLSRLEATGIRVNVSYLIKSIEKITVEINTRTDILKSSKFWKVWSKRFRNANLNSGPQLNTILEGMGYKAKEFTPKGKPKWDERALERVKLPFTNTYLEVKKLKKVRDTYLRGILRETDEDGYLHPSYNLAGSMDDEKKGGAISYRGSVSDPNFQNMPIRNKVMGKWVRQAFISRKGYLLGEVDFKTIEVKIAACVTKDKRLIKYVTGHGDMHLDRACELFFLKPDQVGKKTTRDAAKNKFVFPQFYGDYYISCAKALWEMMKRNEWTIEDSDVKVRDHLRKKGIRKLGKCDPERAPVKGTFEYHVKSVEDHMWNEVFTEYTAWKRRWYQKYLDCGHVTMPTGFVATGQYRRNQVLNLPIQGPAFHCLLWSMTEIMREFDLRKMKSKIVGQIHDCILLDIHESEVQQVLDLCQEVMTVRLLKAWKWIIVPLEVEVDIVPKGLTWNDKEPWVQNESGLWVAA